MDFTNIYSIIANTIIYSLRYAAVSHFLKPKFSAAKTFAILFAGYAAVYLVAIQLAYLSILRFIIGELIFFIPIYICFSDRISRKLFFYAVTVAALFTGELVATSIFHTLYGEDFNLAAAYSVLIGILAIFLSIFILISERNEKLRSLSMKSSEYVAFTFLIITEALMLLGWVNYAKANLDSGNTGIKYSLSTILVAVMCVLSDIMLYRAMTGSIIAHKKLAELETIAAQKDAQKKYYELIASEYNGIRQLRHDISNHMFTVNALLSEGKTDLARQYFEELKESDYFKSKHICRNITADAYLIDRIEKLKSENITVTVDNSYTASGIPVTDTELITILGNLIDNAAEACRHQDDKNIRLSISDSHNFMTVKTENRMPEKYEKQPRFKGLDRGLGSVILEELAQKYGGKYSGSAADGIYRASISIPLN